MSLDVAPSGTTQATQTIKLIYAKIDYAPTLSVYAHMDGVAISLAADFPEWERNPVSLEVASKEHLRKLKMAHNFCAFESVWPENPIEDIALGVRVLSNAASRFSISTAARAGVQVILAIAEDIVYENLAQRFDRKFHVPFGDIRAFDGHSLADMSYQITLKHTQGDQWTRNVQFCPMTRGQWFQFHPLKVRAKDIETTGIDDIRKRIPEVFSYASVEAFTTDISKSMAVANMEDVAKTSIEIANNLHRYLHE